MRNSLIKLLMELPANSTHVTIQGVQMEIINEESRIKLLKSDPQDNFYHHCVLSNGEFIFVIENDKLKKLYKVIPNIT